MLQCENKVNSCTFTKATTCVPLLLWNGQWDGLWLYHDQKLLPLLRFHEFNQPLRVSCQLHLNFCCGFFKEMRNLGSVWYGAAAQNKRALRFILRRWCQGEGSDLISCSNLLSCISSLCLQRCCGKACGAQGAQTRPTAAECSDLGLAQPGSVVPSAPVSVMWGSCTFLLTWWLLVIGSSAKKNPKTATVGLDECY